LGELNRTIVTKENGKARIQRDLDKTQQKLKPLLFLTNDMVYVPTPKVSGQ
jgi:hypothetical protein